MANVENDLSPSGPFPFGTADDDVLGRDEGKFLVLPDVARNGGDSEAPTGAFGFGWQG